MKVFIGSSAEAKELGILDDVASWLEDLGHNPMRWDDPSVFVGGMNIFDRLVQIAQSVDAAVLLFTGDDQVSYRDLFSRQPRDNILLEYGLFAGSLGGSRPVLVVRCGPTKLPTDLGGIAYVPLDPAKPNSFRRAIREWSESIVDNLSPDITRSIPNSGISDSDDLSSEEQLTLGLILADPRAADRGVWIYPLHQQLTYRGFADARATWVLNRLVHLGLIEYVDVATKDSLTNQDTTAPAYRITSKGLNVAESYETIQQFRERFHYVIRISGDAASRDQFLALLRRIPGVESQTRFITEDAEGVSRIAVWSYDPVDEEIPNLALSTGVNVLEVSSGP